MVQRSSLIRYNREMLRYMSNVLSAFLSCTLKLHVTTRSRCSDRFPMSSVPMCKDFEAELLLKDKASLPTQHVTFPCSHPFMFQRGFMIELLSSLWQYSACLKFLLALVAFLCVSPSHSKTGRVRQIT